jgi:predicted SnoaL-like aldol condensation-catalyzing enzyme
MQAIPYTFHYSPIVASGKAYFITFFKETFEKKKIKENLR